MIELFALRDSLLPAEPWRLWTAHLVHYSPTHLVVDAAGWAVPLILSPRARQVASRLVLLGAPIVSVAIVIAGGFDLYAGSSALVVALWVIAGIDLLSTRREAAVLLLLLVVAKIATEAIAGGVEWGGVPASLPVAHAAGATLGALMVLSARLADRQKITLRT